MGGDPNRQHDGARARNVEPPNHMSAPASIERRLTRTLHQAILARAIADGTRELAEAARTALAERPSASSGRIRAWAPLMRVSCIAGSLPLARTIRSLPGSVASFPRGAPGCCRFLRTLGVARPFVQLGSAVAFRRKEVELKAVPPTEEK
jgi:hypothetical protein